MDDGNDDTVTDNEGATGTDTATIVIGVGNQAPIADAGGPYSGSVGSAISFDGSASSDPDGTIVNYYWDFGDGGMASGVAPDYTFAAAGTYIVTLTVDDDFGVTDSATASVSVVDPNSPPNAPSDLTLSVTTTGKGKNRVSSTALSWIDNSDNETGFVIESSEQTGKGKNKRWSAFAVVGSVGSDTTTFDLGTVSGTFKYRVKATGNNGDSGYSNEARR